jgi:hypothetical protein
MYLVERIEKMEGRRRHDFAYRSEVKRSNPVAAAWRYRVAENWCVSVRFRWCCDGTHHMLHRTISFKLWRLTSGTDDVSI